MIFDQCRGLWAFARLASHDPLPICSLMQVAEEHREEMGIEECA